MTAMRHVRNAMLAIAIAGTLACACARKPEALPLTLDTIRSLSTADTQEIRVEDKGDEILVTVVDKHGDGHIHSLELGGASKGEALELLSRKQAELSKRPAISDQWVGQWNGPEGTFLRIDGGNGNYEITIQDLDGPRTYRAFASGDVIRFQRNGADESIRRTNGAETGMKWLSEKTDCLTIRPGEGFCRD
jgi:hypothetical protein